jgi:hypothetical protein
VHHQDADWDADCVALTGALGGELLDQHEVSLMTFGGPARGPTVKAMGHRNSNLRAMFCCFHIISRAHPLDSTPSPERAHRATHESG